MTPHREDRAVTAKLKRVYYPDDDGLPMSDNTWQFNMIVLLHSGLDAIFQDREDVFVAGNHLIYAVKGRMEARQAPDVYVAFGAPRMPRGSYNVWEENGIFPQVVFEVWSPSNTHQAMDLKREFYERHGAEEYYIVYPDFPMRVDAWLRAGDQFARVPDANGHVSPRLGIRFEVTAGVLTVTGPDGRPFLSPAEIVAEREEAERAAGEARRMADEARRATDEAKRAADEARRATDEARRREGEERRAADEARRREGEERDKAARLAAKLRELGIDPDAV